MQWLLHVLLASFVWQSVAISLRSNSSGTRTTAAAGLRKPGCGCDANSPSWHKTSRTQPKCVFIDLGAADGNTFDNFLADGYGPVSNCPHGGDWEAILVEANPVFSKKLKSLEANLGGKVRSLASTAAYSCETTTTFSIDADPTHNFWASSLDEKVGQQEVTVPTINVNKLIAENVRPDDWVILKVDIEVWPLNSQALVAVVAILGTSVRPRTDDIESKRGFGRSRAVKMLSCRDGWSPLLNETVTHGLTGEGRTPSGTN